MKIRNKKQIKITPMLVILIVFSLIAMFFCIKALRVGNQEIIINAQQIIYANSQTLVSVEVYDEDDSYRTNSIDKAKTSFKLYDSNGKKVKKLKATKEDNKYVLDIPDVDSGSYVLKAKTKSKIGSDKYEKTIYIQKYNQYNVTISMDKGIYKPGDEINYRALITDKIEDTPCEMDAQIIIFDGNGNRVYDQSVKSSDYGIVGGTFKLADEVCSGTYIIEVVVNESAYEESFVVNPYVTPKFEININSDSDTYMLNEKAKFTLDASYFFGEKVNDIDYTIYVNGEKLKTIKSASDANFDVNISKAGKYEIYVTATDSSNYYAEATKVIYGKSDEFEIEVLTQSNKIIGDATNGIYVFTKTYDGKPLETYCNIYIDDMMVKQIKTNKNGIGYFERKIEAKRNAYTYDIKVVAQDQNENTVTKTFSIVYNSNMNSTTFKTDKVKYNQGEDISIEFLGDSDSSKTIYLYKSNKLLKTISTSSKITTQNLEDNYGLIDIIVVDDNKSLNSSYSKTIFIKPQKSLNIELKTNKEQYMPGENITLSIDTTDENNQNIESAQLISMIDNANLNLAQNDLTIDNIKLALSDIQFSSSLDAATLYTSILDDEDEITLMSLLLKQETKQEKIFSDKINNSSTKEKYIVLCITFFVIVAILILIYLHKTKPKIFNFILNIFNFLMLTLLFILMPLFIVFEINDYSGFSFAMISIICTAIFLGIYVIFNKEIVKYTKKTSVSIFIINVLYITYLIMYELDFSFDFVLPLLAILACCFVIFAIVYAIKKKNNKLTKRLENIKDIILNILKFIFVYCFAIFSSIAIFDEFDMAFIFPIGFALIYLLNYLANIKTKDKKILAVKIIAIIFGIEIMYYCLEGTDSILPLFNIYDINDYTEMDQQAFMTDEFEDDLYINGTSGFSPSTIKPSASKLPTNITNSITNNKQSNKNEASNINENINENENENEDNGNSNDEVTTKIRNNFLESMCFVTDFIVENGSKSYDLTLADNITTWTIQTIGNTKNGRVGYGKLDNVKVFKDLFVDFEMPKNLVKEDQVSIPITVYNYTQSAKEVVIKIKDEQWFETKKLEFNTVVDSNSSSMIYLPITINDSGTFKMQVEAQTSEYLDIIEKEFTISPKGYEVSKQVISNKIDKSTTEEIFFLDDFTQNTGKVNVKLYSNVRANAIDGIENIFEMPTGCFEQVSSSLYPNILALKYLEQYNLSDPNIKQKALNYISVGYQKILSYEVPNQKGGYSLYGKAPAEVVLTSYGLMELNDMKSVAKVDQSVIDNMIKYIYSNQKIDGSFNVSYGDLKNTAYITWALSQVDPENKDLQKSINYLKDKLDSVTDNYTLALIANCLANVDDKDAKKVINTLIDKVELDDKGVYLKSYERDYFGAYGNYQNLQATALLSMALSKTNTNNDYNQRIINYLISKKQKTLWGSTQATIYVLKAINEYQDSSNLKNQTIKVKLNGQEQVVNIGDNPLTLYNLTFDNVSKENKLEIEYDKGNLYYEVGQSYYVPYEKVNILDDQIKINVNADQNLNVNDTMNANIRLENLGEDISNAMVTINIPQGFVTDEVSLEELVSSGVIEKYETTYSKINIYIRNFSNDDFKDLNVKFRASFPVNVSGLSVFAYDYYNPDNQGKSLPININVN